MSSPVKPVENRRLPAHATASTDESAEPTMVCCRYGAFCKFQISIDASSLQLKMTTIFTLTVRHATYHTQLTLSMPGDWIRCCMPNNLLRAASNDRSEHCVFCTCVAAPYFQSFCLLKNEFSPVNFFLPFFLVESNRNAHVYQLHKNEDDVSFVESNTQICHI